MARGVGCEDENMETSWEATVLTHLRDDGGLDKGESSRNRDTW